MDDPEVDGKTAACAIMFISDLIFPNSGLKFDVPTDMPY